MTTNLHQWAPRPSPGFQALHGQYATLEPLDWAQHGDGLFAAVAGPENSALWWYMAYGPFMTQDEFQSVFQAAADSQGWRPMVIRGRISSEILGMASYMRQREAHGSAEVGCVAFGSRLRRTREATEAIYLMARHVFDDLGYRRFEWKCDTGNDASRRAAERFGFAYEGIFRNDMVIKGRNRDTAWYAMTDGDWPTLKSRFDLWLAPENFDADGRQIFIFPR